MTELQKRLCEEYLKDFNAAAAARRAGYSEKQANAAAYVVLQKPHVQEYLSGLIAKVKERNLIEVDDLVQELKSIAFSDMADFYDEDNDIHPVKKIPESARRALGQYTDERIPSKYGDRTSKTIKLHSKLDAIEKLMRYLGAYEKDNKQKGEIDLTTRSTDDLMNELDAIRRRRSLNDEEE